MACPAPAAARVPRRNNTRPGNATAHRPWQPCARDAAARAHDPRRLCIRVTHTLRQRRSSCGPQRAAVRARMLYTSGPMSKPSFCIFSTTARPAVREQLSWARTHNSGGPDCAMIQDGSGRSWMALRNTTYESRVRGMPNSLIFCERPRSRARTPSGSGAHLSHERHALHVAGGGKVGHQPQILFQTHAHASVVHLRHELRQEAWV